VLDTQPTGETFCLHDFEWFDTAFKGLRKSFASTAYLDCGSKVQMETDMPGRPAKRLFRFLLSFALSAGAVAPSAQATDWSISGTILTPDRVIQDGVLAISGDKIVAVGPQGSVITNTSPVTTSAIILPGFIDLHNHLSWNVLPRWLPSRKFSNRYEWQDVAEYDRNLTSPHGATLDAAPCEVEILAEIKAIAGGATSSLGSLLPNDKHKDNRKCSAGLVRNLDLWSGLPFALPDPTKDPCQKDPKNPQPLLDLVDNEVFPMEMPRDRMEFIACELKAGVLRGLTIHLSEGAPTDASAHREFFMLKGTGLLMPGTGVIHGTALRRSDFDTIAKSGAGLIWSPRSNDELYGATTDIAAADALQVLLAIAPDWSPSGSAGMLQEMGYANRRYPFFTADKLIAMATTNPAKMARIDGYVGSLVADRMADFIVVRGDVAAAAQSTVNATPADVALVVIGGAPVYGDEALMNQLIPGGVKLEPLNVCGSKKLLNLAGTYAAGKSLASVEQLVSDALAKRGFKLPSIECN
jgi:5-methylthioadenosine/S-adenosylhomocysteine deaminase